MQIRSIVIVLTILSSLIHAQEDLPTKVTSGILFAESNPTPIFHEKVASIVYQFKTPNWTSLWSPGFNGTICEDDVYQEDTPFFHCPVLFHQAKIEKHLFPSMNIERFKVKSRLLKNNIADCNLISNKALWTQYLDLSGMNDYLSGIKNCSNGYYLESELIQDFVDFNISTTHESLRDRYYAEYPARLDWAGTTRQGQGGHVLNSKVTNDVIMFHYHVESLRWKQAKTDCNMGLIPLTVVEPGRLNQSLFDIKERIDGDNYQLSLNENYLSSYYSLPLAECAFTDDAFLVHIKVPIVRDDTWSLVSAIQVPIFEPINNSICMVPISKTNFLFQSTTSTAFESTCSGTENPLCSIPEATKRPLEKSCGTATLLEEEEFITELCQLECKPSSRYQLPIFRRVGSDKFTVTGDPGQQFVVQCDTKINQRSSKSVQVITFPDEGAIEVILGCECKILYEEIEVGSQWPCGSETTVSHLIYSYEYQLVYNL